MPTSAARWFDRVCLSPTTANWYWTSSGGQADFARGAMNSEGGQAFIDCRSTTDDGSVSKIVAAAGTRGEADEPIVIV
ncbi:MAG: hypothetical protein QG661_1459, partial [Actinomycetota bacterium]|nr:hypothetical protein [Actinomycetota bacterium]